MIREYAMYKGEELLHIGTLDEIAEAHGVKRDTIFYYSMPAYRRKREKTSKDGNYITVIKLDSDEQ